MIKTENVTKRYASHVAVEHLNLDVRAGEIYGFLGPNGAGKTTTIHMLLNLVRPSSGGIYLFGEPLGPRSFMFKRRIGVVAEEPVEPSKMTGWELVRYFAGLYGMTRPEPRMEKLFHTLELWEVRHGLARDYSRGMRQKLSLIRALIHEPQLLILDEPVSGLDPHGILQVRSLIEEYHRQGGTVFISSHILSEIERSADRIGILHEGRLLVEDSLTGLRRRLAPGQRFVIELDSIPAGLMARLANEPFVTEITEKGQHIEMLVQAQHDVRPRIFHLVADAGGVILGMHSEEMSLEEAFVTITGDNVAQLAGAI